MAISSLRLDTRRALADGTFPVQIKVGYGTDIYLATGDGLAILDRNATYTDANGDTYNRTIKKFNYRGRGATSITNETDIKQSANFVKKGPDGRIYVAYGMYGLQIYEF